jgi:5'(3')-deoxyribonucleotidase
MDSVIYLDMDETLVNLVDPWIDYLNNESGKSLTRAEVGNYSVEENYEDKLSRTKIFKPFKTTGFWVNLPPFEGAIDFVAELDKNYTVYLATIPALGKVCAYEKEKWMAKHLPFLDRSRLILCHHKYLLMGHALLDDNPKYLCHFTGNRLLFDKPWNSVESLEKEGIPPKCFTRIYNYQSCLNFLAQFELPFQVTPWLIRTPYDWLYTIRFTNSRQKTSCGP